MLPTRHNPSLWPSTPYNHKRRSAVFTNSGQLTQKQDILYQAVLNTLTDVLNERILEAAGDKAVQRLKF